MSAANVASGIDFGVTLTPPAPGPATDAIGDWCVPTGMSAVGAVVEEPQASADHAANATRLFKAVDLMSPPSGLMCPGGNVHHAETRFHGWRLE
jgi:hypothetical protein